MPFVLTLEARSSTIYLIVLVDNTPSSRLHNSPKATKPGTNSGTSSRTCRTALFDVSRRHSSQRLSNMSSYGNGHGPSRYQEAALNRSYSGCDQCHHDRKKVGLYTRIPNTRKFICACPSVKAASLVLAVQERRRIVPLAISVKAW